MGASARAPTGGEIVHIDADRDTAARDQKGIVDVSVQQPGPLVAQPELRLAVRAVGIAVVGEMAEHHLVSRRIVHSCGKLETRELLHRGEARIKEALQVALNPDTPWPASIVVTSHQVLGAVQPGDDPKAADIVAQGPVPQPPDGVPCTHRPVPPPDDLGIHFGGVGNGPVAGLDDAGMPEVVV